VTNKRYKQIAHTADVGIAAYGRSMDVLFANAAAGMFSLITDLRGVRKVGEYRVKLKADTPEDLMVAWLSELLYLHETQRLLFKRFDVKIKGGSLDAKIDGEVMDRSRHHLHMVVKAVTYHMIEVNPRKGVVRVIFDI
jgi:SHS2 domain-containing protein